MIQQMQPAPIMDLGVKLLKTWGVSTIFEAFKRHHVA